MLTRYAIVIVALLAASLSTVDADGTPDLTANHLRGVIRERRIKGSKPKKNEKPKKNKKGNKSGGNKAATETGSAPSSAFQDLAGLPILGTGQYVTTWSPKDETTPPNVGTGGGTDNDPVREEDVDDGSTDVADGSMDGAGEGMDANRNGGDCSLNIASLPDKGNPMLPEVGTCISSCECASNCCIAYTLKSFCAPNAGNGKSSFGGGYMSCI